MREDVEGLTESYLEEESATLFSALKEHDLPEHSEPIASSEESFTARSTIWRWTVWFGELEGQIRDLRSWILSADPTSPIARYGSIIAPHKYRSLERMRALQKAREVLNLQQVFRFLRRRLDSPMGATQRSGP